MAFIAVGQSGYARYSARVGKKRSAISGESAVWQPGVVLKAGH
jgi:hypothetical protein